MSAFIISQKWINRFNNQITWRERVYGKPLSALQKIKAARAVSHQRYPSDDGYRGYKGHHIREMFRTEILKTVGVHYKKQTRRQ